MSGKAGLCWKSSQHSPARFELVQNLFGKRRAVSFPLVHGFVVLFGVHGRIQQVLSLVALTGYAKGGLLAFKRIKTGCEVADIAVAKGHD
ncbi:MAG: hypothetical protein GX858_00540, partial [Clostridiales bacterium]|nr:hypothetical protein [Clostridiales bacterium]